MEIIVIVNEIDLHSGRGNGCYLNDQRAVYIVDDHVHTGESYDFVKLVASFVDATVAWHEGPYLFPGFLYALREISAN